MRLGFYDYANAVVGTDGVLFKDKLTDGSAAYVAETGAGSHTYSSAGFTGTATSGLSITGVPGQSTMVEGTIQCIVSKEACTETPGATQQFIVGVGGTTFNLQKLTSGNVSLLCGTRMDHRLSGVDAFFNPEQEATSSDMIPMVVTWDGSGAQLWWNGMLAIDVSWNNSGQRCTFADIRINANTASGGTFTWTDLIISSSKCVLPTGTKGFNVINTYGDSFMQQSQYPGHDTGDLELWARRGPTDQGTDVDTLDGLTATVVNGLGGYPRVETSITATMQRILAKNNLHTGLVNGWPIGGGGIEDPNGIHTVRTRVTASLTGLYGMMPDVAVIVCGYNDAAIADQSTMQASWEAMIDEFVAANPAIKIFIATLVFNTHVDFNPTLSEVQAYNVIINGLAVTYSQVTIVDMFTVLGGATNDNSNGYLLASDNIHPSLTGAIKYGEEITTAILNSL